MAERFSRVFSLLENLYQEGSPILIAAGALLKDNQTGNILAQLKFRNICDKTIKGIKVNVFPQDISGQVLGDPIVVQYLDLTVQRDEFFGQKQPIKMPDSTTRGFSVCVCTVFFSDSSTWDSTEREWIQLPNGRPLQTDTIFQDTDLLQQYHIKYGKDCIIVPEQVMDLWYCSCGALNSQEETDCHKCSRKLEDLLSVDVESLRLEKEARLKIEAAEKAEADIKASVFKKKILFATAIAAVIAAAYFITVKVILPNQKYNNAISILEAGNYEEAISAFDALGEYKDSTAYQQYSKAASLLEAEKYEEAVSAFEALGGFKDSAARADQAKDEIYIKAIDQFEKGQLLEAALAFTFLGDYKSSQEYLKKIGNDETVNYALFIDYIKKKGTWRDDKPFIGYVYQTQKTDVSEEYWGVKKSEPDKLYLVWNYFGENEGLTFTTIFSSDANLRYTNTTPIIGGNLSLTFYMSGTVGKSNYVDNKTITPDLITPDPSNYRLDKTIFVNNTTAFIRQAVMNFKHVLEQSDLGLSMKDMGFYEY